MSRREVGTQEPSQRDLESEPSDESSVSGERSTPLVNGIRSIQSRISNLLAAGLMIALGVGALSWYYANALGRQTRVQQAGRNNAQGEMPLPPLDIVRPPAVTAAPVASPDPTPVAATSQSVSIAQRAEQGRASWSPAPGAEPSYGLAPYGSVDPYHPPPHPVISDRRLSGVAFSRESGQFGAPAAASKEVGTDPTPFGSTRIGTEQAMGMPPDGDGLGKLLRPRFTTPARAELVPTQQFLLPKGAFIDCTLETAIDSTLPGMTTCITATDTFGIDGKVVLLERGSKLIGETRGEVQNGAARIFVLWTEARTPTGVRVPLDSPGTDELGRSGLPGEVNRHFWDRFGAAMLISVVNGAVQAGVQAASHGGGAIIYSPSTAQEALTDVLKGTINLPPTITKHQGDRIQILVARDLDFRSVYELRTTEF